MNGGVEPHLFPNLEITKIILNKDGLAEWNLFDIKVTSIKYPQNASLIAKC